MAKSNITGTPKLISNFEEKVKEYERRIDVLTFCLEEKVLENNNLLKKLELKQSTDNTSHLLEQIKDLERYSKEKNDEIEELQEGLHKMEDEKEAAKKDLDELRRKYETLVLERRTEARKVRENGPEKATTSTPPDKADEKYKRQQKDKKRMEDLLFDHEEQIEKLKEKLKDKDKKLRVMASKLNKEQERRMALVESNEEYEKRHQSLERELLDALRKEGERRMEAEYWQDNMRKKLKKLKKKHKKLKGAAEAKPGKKSEGDKKEKVRHVNYSFISKGIII